MERIANYSDQILRVFNHLISEFGLEIYYPNDMSMELANEKFTIRAWVERYEQRVNFSFSGQNSKNIHSSLEVYVAKGRPQVEHANTGNRVIDNIIWHERFIRMYMRDELLTGDFDFS